MQGQAWETRARTPQLTRDACGSLVLHLAVLLGTTWVPLYAGVEALLVDACLVSGALRVVPATHRCSAR